jgi:zinc transporter ZupT
MATSLDVQYERGNAWMGAGLSLTSAAGTLLGATAIYCTRFVRLCSPVQLTRALSFASGAMIFTSLVEFSPHAAENFQLAIEKSASSIEKTTIRGFVWVLVTVAYSVGISLMFLVDAVVNQVVSILQQRRHRQSKVESHPVLEEAPTFGFSSIFCYFELTVLIDN